MNNFSKTLIKFITSVKNDITFENVAKYLNKHGVEIIFADTPNGDKRISELNIANIVKGHKAITVFKKNTKCIVISNEISSENKLHMLLHELSHILLGHINTDYYNAVDSVKIDNEAEAFTYQLLHTNKLKYVIYKLIKNKTTIISSIVMGVLISVFAVNYTTKERDKIDVPKTVVSEIAEIHSDTTPTPQNTDLVNADTTGKVYITPTGTKYHKYNCHTIDKNTAIEISIDKAKKSHYEPCKICNPDK